VDRIAAAHHVTLEEGVLLALEIACRKTATVRHGQRPEEDPAENPLAADPVATTIESPPALAPLLDEIRALLTS
jgi:hypothetical protein